MIFPLHKDFFTKLCVVNLFPWRFRILFAVSVECTHDRLILERIETVLFLFHHRHIVQLELTFNYHPSSLMHARIRIMLSSFLPSLPTKERLQ